jgi:hypothetical protein
MSEIPGQSGHALPDFQQPVCAITGRSLIADHFVGAKHPGFMSSGPRGSRLATIWHRSHFWGAYFWVDGQKQT